MRGKRSKQYRKLMHQYALAFNFREPYQVLLDAEIIQDTTKFKMDLPHLLSRTLHGQVKPMITQCCIRQLYLAKTEDRAVKNSWIETAKGCERRKCGHQELEEPLGAEECIMSVVDPKDSGTNKHRYIVASQDAATRRRLRGVAGVPLVYVQRSVMVMEPMAARSEEVKDDQEREKVRSGVKRGKSSGTGEKRKREGKERAQGREPAERYEVEEAPRPLGAQLESRYAGQDREPNQSSETRGKEGKGSKERSFGLGRGND
ncbi:Fcf1-domain-containing protein [Elsinoe ampelina]|uniref:U three protein 23 n=1 Tax=Elsinoe ampelina TaxID=302913 RepID=A0A6A6G8I0_9PEZI|nr:Fcf1-domain-containing protein [Elsinoe ampelina]